MRLAASCDTRTWKTRLRRHVSMLSEAHVPDRLLRAAEESESAVSCEQPVKAEALRPCARGLRSSSSVCNAGMLGSLPGSVR